MKDLGRVSSCRECPWLRPQYALAWCEHPKSREQPPLYADEEPLPHWCPLPDVLPDEESAKAQIDRLAAWIMENIPGEPSQSQGAVDTAIRLLGWMRKEARDGEESR